MRSPSTRRPSASGLLTSIVVPSRAVTMSPGLTAVPLGRFSAAPISAVTWTGGRRAATAAIASITAAPPAMSNFISCIVSAGLSASPPASNVIALPINATLGEDGPLEPEPEPVPS